MRMSLNGRQLLCQLEDACNQLYNDVAGKATIGVGHLLTREEVDSGLIRICGVMVDFSQGLSDQQVMDLLEQDLATFENAVNDAVHVPLSQNQFDALVSFVFNVGIGAFRDSTLLKVVNRQQFSEVPAELLRWVRSGGKVIKGLGNRRKKEIELWET
jgi:lysozyme